MNYNQDIDLITLLPLEWTKYMDKKLLMEVNNNLKQEIQKNPNSYFFPYNVNDIFRIFHLCKLQEIKVVILGQDPYYSNKFQANGIAFSVNKNVVIPASLRNIFKEAKITPSHGDLTHWVQQGVFLLNASLTVKEKLPNSHEYMWKKFIQHIIDIINTNCDNVIFVSWGASAHNKYGNLNLDNHHMLTSSHPSPLSCYKTDKPFIGSNVFNKINEILKNNNKKEINWVSI